MQFNIYTHTHKHTHLGPLCYSAGLLTILKEFRANPPVPGTRAVSFIDDITVILPPELSLDMAAKGEVTEWLQERLGVEAGSGGWGGGRGGWIGGM